MSTVTSTSTKPVSTSTTKASTKRVTTSTAKASTAKASTAKPASTDTRKNAARNADRTPDLGTFKAGDTVTTADARVWTVVGPAQGGTTLKLTREQDGKKESVFRFARNITPAK